MNSNDFKLSNKDQVLLLAELQEKINSSALIDTLEIIELISDPDKKGGYLSICQTLINKNTPQVFLCCLLFIKIKESIMAHKKEHTHDYFELLGDITHSTPYEKLNLKYDNTTVLFPYALRVGLVGALYDQAVWEPLLLKKCSKLESDKVQAILDLFKALIPYFQITFDESIKQSGISLSGTDYESRIEDLLKFLGLQYEKHQHEKDFASDQEHDFIFYFENKIFGIGAKRTLRERYKQYNPKGVDLVPIVFTIGLDLGEDKLARMTENYKQKIFVADEVYFSDNNLFLQKNIHVFPISKFTIETLRTF